MITFETWSLTLREVCRLKVFENRILGRIFGSKRNANGERRRLLYRSPNILREIKSRRLRWRGPVARMEDGKSVFKILICKNTRNIPLGRPRSILEWILKK